MCSSASRHRRRDARHPQIEQPIEPAQRVRGEDRARRRRLARDGPAKPVEHAIRDRLAAAVQQPGRDRFRVIGAGHDQGRPMPGESPDVARLAQIARRVVQPEQPSSRAPDKPDHAMPAIADVEIAGCGHVARQRHPAHAVVGQRLVAAIADLDRVTARRQRFGQRHKGGLGAAQRRGLGHAPVERDAVVGHHHTRHQRRSDEDVSTPVNSPSP